jgi:hypothetical protein
VLEVLVGAAGDEHPVASTITAATQTAPAHLFFVMAATGVVNADAQNAALARAAVIPAC